MKITKTLISIFFATFLTGIIVITPPKNKIAASTVTWAKSIKSLPTPPIETEIKKEKSESPVKVVGTFMKVETDGEHASGYQVELWRQDEKFYGLIFAHRGLIGDPPAGLLEDVRFDSVTKKISFRAKLTLGLFFDKTHANVPSQDVFVFEGFLNDKKLKGDLLMTNELCANKCPEKQKIILPRSKEWSSEMMDEYQTFADWKTYANETLKRLGPSW